MKKFKIAIFALVVLCSGLIFVACGKGKTKAKTFDEQKIVIVERDSNNEISLIYNGKSQAFSVKYEGEPNLLVSYSETKNGEFVSKDELDFVNANTENGHYSAYFKLSAPEYEPYVSAEPVEFSIKPKDVVVKLDKSIRENIYYNLHNDFIESDIFAAHHTTDLVGQDGLGDLYWDITSTDGATKFPNAEERKVAGWADALVGKEYVAELVGIGNTNYKLSSTQKTQTKLTVVNNVQVEAAEGEVEYFDSLQTALTSATASATITLFNNFEVEQEIKVDKNLTFNGNGYKIKAAEGYQPAQQGELKVATLFNVQESGNVVLNLSNLTLNGNNFARAISAFGSTVNLNKVNVTGGKKTDNYYAGGVFMTNNSTLNAVDSRIVGNDGAQSGELFSDAFIDDLWVGANAKATISGKSELGNVFVNMNQHGDANKGKLTLNGGKINDLWLEYYVEGGTRIGAEFEYQDGEVSNLYIAKDYEGNEHITIQELTKGTTYVGGKLNYAE